MEEDTRVALVALESSIITRMAAHETILVEQTSTLRSHQCVLDQLMLLQQRILKAAPLLAGLLANDALREKDERRRRLGRAADGKLLS